jgi:NAD(P)-dependent dehydrogenase (short-subunit alcohol dehydrogenase family)
MSKTALITGASRGLGRNTALALARRGSDIILTYRSQHGEAAQVVAEIEALGRRALALPLDVSDSASFEDFAMQVEATLGKWDRKGLDVLVNNAGHGIHRSFADTSEEDFDSLMRAHLKGPFFLTQRLLPYLVDGAVVINLSSGLARFTQPGYAAYGSMKGAMEVLTRYLARELGPRGIRVNAVAPGAIETDFGGGAVRDNAALNEALASHTALGRVGVPDDIGPMIAALAGDENRWITGQRIEVSGGMFL